ncbi:MAG: phage tail tape measure protein [Aequorivita sp.]|nr:phage tail tape measure protein [Aequorivita sp.]
MASQTQQLTVAIKLNDQFSKGMGEIEKKVNVTFSDDENKKGSFLSGVKKSQVALTALAGGGLLAVGKGITSAFNSAREFEQSMADVSAITGATGKQFDDLSMLARDMGAKTAFSANQAAEGIQFLGMAGFDTDQIMTALPDTLSLASAAGMDLGAAADISSNILSGMGMTAGDLGGVVDKLAQTSRNANTDVSQLGEAFKMVGPTSAAAGVSFDDTTTSLGLLANAGLQGSIGGTSLNAAFRSMINPSNDAAKAAEKLGLTFTDATGNIKPMEQILTEVDSSAMTTQQSFEIFGVQGARAMNALRAQGVEAFQKLDDKIKESGGVAENMAKTRLGSFDGAMKQLKSGISEFSISVGEELLPAANTIINDFLMPAMQATNNFIRSFGGFGEMFKATKELFTAFVNTGKNIFNELFSSPDFAEEFLGNLVGLFKAGAEMFVNFHNGMTKIWKEAGKIIWEPFKQSFLALWDFIKMPLVSGINNIKLMFVKGANAIIEEFNNLGEVFGLTIDKIDFTPITVEAPKTFKERWAEGTENVGNSIDKIKDIANDMAVTFGEDADKVVGAMEKTVESASHLVDDDLDRTLDAFSNATKTMEVEAKKDGKVIGKNLGGEIKNTLVDNMPQKGFLSSKIELGKNLLGSFGEQFGDKSKGIGSVLGNAFKGGMNGSSFKQVISAAATQVGTMLAGPIGGLVAGGLAKVMSGVFGKGSKAKRAMARADTNIGILEDAFARGGGDFNFVSGEDVRSIEGYNTRGLKDNATGYAIANKLVKEEGFTQSEARLLVFNILPKLAKGQKLPAKETRLVNKAFRNLSVRRKAEELLDEERAENFEDSVEADAMKLNKAAGGYEGMVGSPTMFLAGEAGPEHVSITPSSRMRGGFQGGGGGNMHFNFNVSSIDSKGVREFLETDAKDILLNVLQRESARGRSVIYDTGITTDPSI